VRVWCASAFVFRVRLLCSLLASFEHTLELDGFRVNGPLHESSELTICYRGAISYAVEGVFATDALRLAELRDAPAQAARRGTSRPLSSARRPRAAST
jgi:hypothetical protein